MNVADAHAAGRAAFAAGLPAAPVCDPVLMDNLRGLQVGESEPFLAAWVDGWHSANLKAVARG